MSVRSRAVCYPELASAIDVTPGQMLIAPKNSHAKASDSRPASLHRSLPILDDSNEH